MKITKNEALQALEVLKSYIEQHDEGQTEKESRPISDLDISVGTYNFIKTAGIETIGELVTAYKNGKLNVAIKSKRRFIKEIYELLAAQGYDVNPTEF